jgi:hypothetical protein
VIMVCGVIGGAGGPANPCRSEDKVELEWEEGLGGGTGSARARRAKWDLRVCSAYDRGMLA